jgi:hypothetical protein
MRRNRSKTSIDRGSHVENIRFEGILAVSQGAEEMVAHAGSYFSSVARNSHRPDRRIGSGHVHLRAVLKTGFVPRASGIAGNGIRSSGIGAGKSYNFRVWSSELCPLRTGIVLRAPETEKCEA